MRDGEVDTYDRPLENTEISVWDSQYVLRGEAFSYYRGAICKVFMPWSPEPKPGSEFHARVEALAVDEGSIGRIQLSPLVAMRNAQCEPNRMLPSRSLTAFMQITSYLES